MKEAYSVINKESQNPIILTCEHASNTIPEGYHNLGLTDSELDTHIARDKGCGRLTELLAQKINATAFIANYSRVFIDYNRREHEESLILNESDKILIPGNQNLTNEERQYRISHFHRPYYSAIKQKISELTNNKITPIIFSIHAFTPQLRGGSFRPWNAGVLYVSENKFAIRLFNQLKEIPELNIGANVPYDMRQYNTGSAGICGEDLGFENAVIEIRDTEFENVENGAQKWCDILSKIIG